jgi:hypothetical protein
MPFFARPNLDDVQFKQLPGSELNLSGLTNISSWSGLTLSDGASGSVIITASGATPASDGQVMTYRGGIIALEPTAASGDSRYYGMSPTTTTVGGLPTGSAISGCTIECILQTILVPAIPLSVSLSIATPIGGDSRQFGDSVYGNLCWSVIKNTNYVCVIRASDGGDGVYYTTIFSGGTTGTTNGLIPYTFNITGATPATGTSSTSVAFYLSAATTANEIAIDPATITWMNKKYYFKTGTAYYSSNCTTACAAMCTSSVSQLSTSRTFNCSLTFNNEFFYYAYPTSFGAPSFTINGLPNNAWGSLLAGTLFPLTFINECGYANQYYIARSDSRITGVYSIIVS